MLLFPVLGLMSACLNGVLIETDAATQLVAKASRALEEKKYAAVIEMLVPPDSHWMAAPRLLDVRAELIAIAQVRSGKVGVGLRVLTRLAKKRSQVTLTQARYAEAMFATGDRWRRWDARKILERLEREDLMPDAESWAVLAAIRRVEKDDAGEAKAMARCKAISPACAPMEPQS